MKYVINKIIRDTFVLTINSYSPMSQHEMKDINLYPGASNNGVNSNLPLDQIGMNMFCELSPDLFCIVSKEGNFLYLNPSWTTITGYTIEELINTAYLALIHPDDIEKTIQNFNENLETTGVFVTINRCKCKDGSYKWLECRGNSSLDKKTIFAVARDITKQKEAEDELRIKEERYRLLADNQEMLFGP